MSQISKALKKVQESRQEHQVQKAADIVYLTDAPQAWPKTILMVILAFGILAAVLLGITAIMLTLKNSESKQVHMLGLDKIIKTQEKNIKTQEKTIKAQEKRINDFISAINKNQKFADSQMRDLNFRLNKESKDIKVQMDDLTLNENSQFAKLNNTYSNLNNGMLDNKKEIDSLDNYTKKLDQEIKTMSDTNSQIKDPTIPAIGN